jgi:hypothetical protein
MSLTIELDREIDGRWIAEISELNVLLYAASKQDAIQRVQSAARKIVLDRIAHGELPPDSANAVFDVASLFTILWDPAVAGQTFHFRSTIQGDWGPAILAKLGKKTGLQPRDL